MKAYSQDLRQRIVAAVQQSNNKSQVARTFQVSLATVKRLCALAETGTLTPKRRPGRPPAVKADHYDQLLQRLHTNPDTTLNELTEWWAAQTHSHRLSQSTLSRLLVKLGWSRKKRPLPPANATRPHEPNGAKSKVR